MGLTNAYTDAQDLFIETIDPQNPDAYLEAEQSFPFETIEEVLKIKDEEAEVGYREEKMVIRLTHRGPVISGLINSVPEDKIVTFRWAGFEAMQPEVGLEALLTSKTAQEARKNLQKVTLLHVNVVLADKAGTIGWITTGRLPLREKGVGIFPTKITDRRNHWLGWVDPDSMPYKMGQNYSWIGTANHNTVPSGYPHYVSSYFSPRYRYQRLKKLMESHEKLSLDDHWKFQRDSYNTLAASLAPVYSEKLLNDPETKEIGQILLDWDFVDDKEAVAPAIFQLLHMRLAKRVFEDELGEELSQIYLDAWYVWQERLEQMVLRGDSDWFDDIRTESKAETLDELIVEAGKELQQELTQKLGEEKNSWTWGKIHQITFLNPIRRGGTGSEWLGAGTYQMAGSGETLYRGLFDFGHPDQVNFHAV